MKQPTRRDFLAAFAAAAAPPGDWKAHGFSEAQREEIRGYLRAASEAQEIAGGSLAIVHEGEVILREGFGYADLESQEPFGVDRINHLASVSKSITSTVAVMLDEKGILSLDAPVKKYLPEYADVKLAGQPLERDILVWQGLAHRSGFAGNGERGEDAQEVMHLSVQEYMARKLADGLSYQPGDRFDYGGLGYMMVQSAIEKTTGKPFDAVARELLLDPLGMPRTTLRPSDDDLAENPTRYQRRQGKLTASRTFPNGYGARNLLSSAGGYFSTLDDMSRFVAFHLAGGVADGKRLVSSEKLARMRRPHPADPGEFAPYGLGLNLQPGRIGEARHLGASGAMIWLSPGRKVGGVLLTQTRWEGNRRFQDAFEAKVTGVFAA
jgi:CubicO group peptidase (beta-lactamase class C family)